MSRLVAPPKSSKIVALLSSNPRLIAHLKYVVAPQKFSKIELSTARDFTVNIFFAHDIER